MEEFNFENFDCKVDNKELGYEFKKEISSNTQARAYHVKIDNINYQIVTAPFPRLYTITSGYLATRTGKIIDHEKQIFSYKSDDIDSGVIELLSILKFDKEPLIEKVNMT